MFCEVHAVAFVWRSHSSSVVLERLWACILQSNKKDRGILPGSQTCPMQSRLIVAFEVLRGYVNVPHATQVVGGGWVGCGTA